MPLTPDRPVAPFLCGVCAVPCCVAEEESPIRHGQELLRAATTRQTQTGVMGARNLKIGEWPPSGA